ncbi:MAG: winged helix-turn-helix transcriptional regulator [Clostridiales bacterium]|nr:winged helix-turn-helix transcriptional regulator [Clostridiales bacterium]
MNDKDLICDCEVIHEDVVTKVKENMSRKNELTKLANFFKIFGDSTRISIINALDIHEMCVCDLAVLLNMTKSAISHQLRNLRNAGLVKSRREGKVVYYSLNDKHVQDIFEIGLDHIRHLDEDVE